MNRTKIEWVRNPDGSQGYTWNPITGCLNHVNGLCKGGSFPCYAYKLAHGRLSSKYLAGGIVVSEGKDHENLSDPFYPRFWKERLNDLPQIGLRVPWSKERGIFVCDMGDLFGTSIPEEWTRRLLERMKAYGEHRFYLLTKQPQRLPEFSPFPENCWVGVTATNAEMFKRACNELHGIEAAVKFVSVEPLLSWDWHDDKTDDPMSPAGTVMDYMDDTLDWLIIGACTGSSWEMVKLGERYNRDLTEPSAMTRLSTKWTLQPRIEWLREIVEAADKAQIPVFLKDNLKPLIGQNLGHTFPGFAYKEHLRQEMPK